MNKIKDYRKKQNWSLETLSFKSNLSIGYLCHLEKGTRKNPSYNTMKKISNAFNKSITDIFDE